MTLRWYPIHTHLLPAGLAGTKLVGAVLCLPPAGAIADIEAGMAQWPGKEQMAFCPLFSLEQETDLGNLGALPRLRSLGLVSLQLLRERKNSMYFDLARGLTDSGTALLRRMADLDMLLDLSHLHGPVLTHVLNAAPGRRMVSHVVCQEVFPWSLTRRANAMDDAELAACDAELYGIPFVDDLVSARPSLTRAERQAGVGDVADHILHLARVVGPERVALGPDYFDYDTLAGAGIEVGSAGELDQVEGLARLWQALRDRGLNEGEVEGVFWRNASRVLPPEAA
ncbi:membrane dipeptidase [Solidesulfovibrio sp.]|uniref:membrane dipeptidase n=1 Tax=Solidesulfovibrio sp. TaxID=2910990 RepID=UPI002B1F71DC|nr:membrane dipeptidase [Solidesulfovibrio sp.]MEA5089610.1 membrane dipeptidase [Solidesulfovibrio sp.]